VVEAREPCCGAALEHLPSSPALALEPEADEPQNVAAELRRVGADAHRRDLRPVAHLAHLLDPWNAGRLAHRRMVA